jgi:hypothetical protein
MLYDVTVGWYSQANNNKPVFETTWRKEKRVADDYGGGVQIIASAKLDMYYVDFVILDMKQRVSSTIFPFKFGYINPQAFRRSVVP